MKKYIFFFLFFAGTFLSLSAQNELWIDDFENGDKGWEKVNTGWVDIEIVDNPQKSGINTSSKVMKCVRKTNSEFYAGLILRGEVSAQVGPFPNEYRYAHVKVLKETNGKVGFKIEGGPNNSTYAAEVPYTPNGEWQELVFDIAGGLGTFRDFFIMVDQATTINSDITVYIDDIVLKTDPNAEDFEEVLPGTFELVWQDEFDGDKLDTEKWNYETDATHGHGGGNHEWQVYVQSEDNCFIRDGKLVIRVIQTGTGDRGYTSTRITTQGKGDWKYGKVEASLKLPAGRGTWPAFWMMPTYSIYGGWPYSGELDIMEYVGYDPGVVHGNVHRAAGSGGNSNGNSIAVNGVEDEFHTYTIEWEPGYIKWYVDGVHFHTYQNFKDSGPAWWPFDQEFFAILNFAVGGDWGGSRGVDEDPANWPKEYEIDYVRVYQKKEETSISKGTEAKKPNVVQLPGDLVKVENLLPGSSIEVYTTSGTKLLHISANQQQEVISLSTYPKGIYIIRVIDAESSYSEKILKK
ncbi:MAG: family 16 glycosylhydrolase [Candidatus Azobacteroides sp.]|nr:family 16 glycosylhydrolase [Candidatus Azobacteroides sp.]